MICKKNYHISELFHITIANWLQYFYTYHLLTDVDCISFDIETVI